MTRKALQLDFVVPRHRGRVAGYIVLAVSLMLGGTLVFKYSETRQRLYELEAAEVLLGGKRPARAIPRERLEAEMKSAQATVRQLSLPWAQLIDSLERAATQEVAVLNIQPDAQNRVLRVSAEARREGTMLEYLRRLEATGSFAEVHLVSHQVRQDAPGRPIQFSLQASFKGKP
jgi:Fimbrial assembly protein (PilN)